MGNRLRLILLALACFTLVLFGQAPTGSIAGTVTDESGAAIPDAAVRLTHKETGVTRTVQAALDGTYLFAALHAGDYELRADAKGFRPLVRAALVETGSTTMADLRLQVGATTEVVTVEGALASISYDSHKIDGVVTRQQIDSLPLNGRSFLQLAFLEPGVTVAPATLAQYNAQFSVSVLGAPAGRTSINADGGNVRDRTTGNTGQNFSQEVVQEFQLSAVNFDLSTGITSVGSVNIVTRSGTNDYHGAGYFAFRDHNMAAYPALRRDPRNPDPFFARRHSGFWVGGPLKRDRLFFFFNLEHGNQDSVYTVQPNTASLASFAQIAPSPYTTKQISNRFDYVVSPRHTLFLRYSHDGNRGNAPQGAPTQPSNWLVNDNWADQNILGFTSALRPTLVNDFRFQYWYWRNRNLHPSSAECPGCVGLGFPQVSIAGTNFVMGNTQNATQGRDYRAFQWTDNMTWQKGSHRFRFGGEWEMDITKGFWGFCEPACITVWSPENARARNPNIALPSSFRSMEDLLELPVLNTTIGYGSPLSPAPFQRDNATTNHRIRVFWQDSWRLHPRFTLNYGAAWQAETTLANHDLPKAPFLAPILGGGKNLEPTRRDWNNITPSLGFAWNLTNDNKTVIRAGAGIYYDTQFLWERLNERQLLGPYPNGRLNIAGGRIGNTIAGIPGVPVGAPLDFASNPTEFRLRHFMTVLPQIPSLLPPPLPYTGIDVVKSATGLSTIFPTEYPTMYGQHYNIGVQRQVRRDLVVTVDFVMRQFLRQWFGNGVDLDPNRWNSARGAVIPACTGAAAVNPAAQCSTGPIQTRIPGARSNYKGLLVRADKRYANRFQIGASYAFQTRHGVNGNVNKDDWFFSWGPDGPKQVLNVSGVLDLPAKFQFSFISAASSRGPVMPVVVGIDLDGDGTGFEPLPGASYNGFNRGLGKQDLERLVADFNQKYAGTRTPRNQLVSALRLPTSYEFGDVFTSQDIRLSRTFQFKERYKINVYGEMFNVFNVANLAGYSFALDQPTAFGQPTLRANQIFGSGAPRVFQLGARVSF